MDRAAHDPGQRDAGRLRPRQQPLGRLRLGGKGRVRHHTHALQPRRLVGPALLRQVEFRVQQRVPLRPHVGQEDPTWQFPPRAAVLPRHSGRVGALLQECGLVDDAHGPGIAQMILPGSCRGRCGPPPPTSAPG